MGDLVQVNLTVEAKDEAGYVLLDDPLPAGFEAINERLNTVSYGGGEVMYWRDWGYNRKNLYDDHVTFFITYLWAGQHSYSYLMRATTAGEFSVPPAQIYPMYEENMWGRSDSHRLSVDFSKLVTRPLLSGDFDRDCRLTDFDLRQVAGAWGTSNVKRDLNQNGQVDLTDLSLVSTRQGNTCLLTQPTLPITGSGQAKFAIVSQAEQMQVSQPFTVNVMLEGLSGFETVKGVRTPSSVGGFGVTLSFDPTLLQIAKLTANPMVAEALPLGPYLDNKGGRVAFGAFNLPTPVLTRSQLATIIFVAQQSGQVEFSSANIQAMNGQGQIVEAVTVITNAMVHNEVYLPVIVK